VAAVIGHLNSGTTIAAARVYNDAGIPQIAPAATNPQYTSLGYKYAVRLMATDIQQGSGISAFLAKNLKARSVALIDDRTAYGKGLADQVASDLTKAGIAVVKREYTTDRATDFTAILTTIKAANPDAIVYAGADAQAGPLNRQMKQLGLSAKFIAGDGVCTGSWSKLAAGANEGYFCTQAGAPRTAMAQFGDFEKRFRAKFNTDVVVFAPYAYDAVQVITQAMRDAKSTDPKVFAALVPKVELKGVTGPIKFDARGDNLNGVVSVYEVRGGKLEIAR
jgi:branched-chain amino acid transport system substrate-binding protein